MSGRETQLAHPSVSEGPVPAAPLRALQDQGRLPSVSRSEPLPAPAGEEGSLPAPRPSSVSGGRMLEKSLPPWNVFGSTCFLPAEPVLLTQDGWGLGGGQQGSRRRTHPEGASFGALQAPTPTPGPAAPPRSAPQEEGANRPPPLTGSRPGGVGSCVASAPRPSLCVPRLLSSSRALSLRVPCILCVQRQSLSPCAEGPGDRSHPHPLNSLSQLKANPGSRGQHPGPWGSAH